MNKPKDIVKAIVIGGSAGSFKEVNKILQSLPNNYPIPIFITMHRLRSVKKGFTEVLENKCSIPILEPEDKDLINPPKIYLAPSNYHMSIELGGYISLSTEELFHNSRPSIDVTFKSAARAYREQLCGILLSGANKDGAYGMESIEKYGGITIVQSPETCLIDTMPRSAIEKTNIEHIFSTEKIIEYLLELA